MVIFAWIKGVKNEQETHFTGSIESDPIDSFEQESDGGLK